MFGYIVKLAVAAGLIGFLVHNGQLDFRQMLKLSSLNILTCMVLGLIALFFVNARWLVLLRSQGFDTNFKNTFELTLMGVFFNYALPSSIGGDVVKAYYLVKDNVNKKASAAMSVVVDRVIGLIVMMSLAFLSMVVNLDHVESSPELKSLFLLITLMFFGGVIFLAFAFSKSINSMKGIQKVLAVMPGFLSKVYNALHAFGRCKKSIFYSVVLSYGSQLTSISFMYLVAQGLGYHQVPFAAFIFAIPIGFMVMSVPIAPAGLGVGQLALLYLFKVYLGYQTDIGQIGITIFQLVNLCFGLVGAFLYTKRKKNIDLSKVVA